jgi:hypothetical protein
VPLQNRVTPLGELITTPERGLVYGNRGCLHNEHGEIRRHHNGKLWIACRLRFRGWHRSPLLQRGRFTELFFLDEATAFAAGHRPCALCRREDYNRFKAIWSELHPRDVRAEQIDSTLQSERWGDRTQRLHSAPFAELPDGAFVLDAAPKLVLGRELLSWAPGGYRDRGRRPRRGTATVITPPSLVDVLRAGWDGAVPLLHPSANRPDGI